jgi:hypothetical protein
MLGVEKQEWEETSEFSEAGCLGQGPDLGRGLVAGLPSNTPEPPRSGNAADRPKGLGKSSINRNHAPLTFLPIAFA